MSNALTRRSHCVYVMGKGRVHLGRVLGQKVVSIRVRLSKLWLLLDLFVNVSLVFTLPPLRLVS